MREEVVQPGQRLLTANEQVWTKNVVICTATMRLLFFEIYKSGV
jgi:hypothetical protein